LARNNCVRNVSKKGAFGAFLLSGFLAQNRYYSAFLVRLHLKKHQSHSIGAETLKNQLIYSY